MRRDSIVKSFSDLHIAGRTAPEQGGPPPSPLKPTIKSSLQSRGIQPLDHLPPRFPIKKENLIALSKDETSISRSASVVSGLTYSESMMFPTMPREAESLVSLQHPTLRVLPGRPFPLGATWDGMGTNFAVFSEDATEVYLCLFDSAESTKESLTILMPEYTDHVWHVYLRNCQPGQLYGYRVHGPFEPEKGLRFNPNKVLLDPYAKQIGRMLTWSPAMFPYNFGSDDLSFSEEDNAHCCPLACVADSSFTWADDKPPRTAWNNTIIYETHVRGFTKRHPQVPKHLQGTYLGIASEPIIRHLKKMGITAIELLPVHKHVDEMHLVEKGLSNYWGYNTLSFFAPDPRYATSPDKAVQEFKMMVRALHKEGIEVILDVVYNHTAEGNHMGPMFSLKGFDNRNYYRLVQGDERYYMDYTGCGNTLNAQSPRVLQLIMDSLRYWITEMHVDGFRFDLCSALARELYDVDKLGSFFDVIHQDPVVSVCKLIAEPWDVGPGGYQVGNFPVLWAEWNGKYRDSVRSFWNGPGTVSLGEFATRVAGSSDLYEHSGRKPASSINFVTAHDGFTLWDLVSYCSKHNEANGHNNTDGENENRSANFGIEGPTSDTRISNLRQRQRRNFFATLLLSQGVPMVRGGDEIGQTQRGNNNVYNQDNELSWYDWEEFFNREDNSKLFKFVCSVLKIRRENIVLHRRRFFRGMGAGPENIPDVKWISESGSEMTEEDWRTKKVFGMLMDGSREAIHETDEEGGAVEGDTLLFFVNPQHTTSANILLPTHRFAIPWQLILDTATTRCLGRTYAAGDLFVMPAMSITLFKLADIEFQDFGE